MNVLITGSWTGEIGADIDMLPPSAKESVALGFLLALDRAGIRTDRANAQRLFWGTRFWRWCSRCSARSWQRDALSELDDRLLEDIGVTQRQANAEVAKPFWK